MDIKEETISEAHANTFKWMFDEWEIDESGEKAEWSRPPPPKKEREANHPTLDTRHAAADLGNNEGSYLYNHQHVTNQKYSRPYDDN